MNALIVYDSQFGNTEKIAKKVAAAIGKSAKAVHVSKADARLNGVDMLIVASPTQAWRATPAIRSFLEKLPGLIGIPAAAFDTRFKRTRILTGSAARGISKALEKKGAKILMPPESFFVESKKGPLLDGELERAEKWAMEIAKTHNVRKKS